MKETPQDRISFTIQTLEDALKKCERVDYTENAGSYDKPTYIIGWCTAILRNSIIDLKKSLKELN